MPEIGPGSFRAVFGPLARCLFLGMPPASKWWDFPVGLLNPWPSPCQSWLLPPEGDHLWAGLGSFVETGCSNFLSAPAHSVAAAGSHQEFWAEQIEQLEKFCSAQIRRRSEGAFPLDPAAEQGGQNGEGGFTEAELGILSRSAPKGSP